MIYLNNPNEVNKSQFADDEALWVLSTKINKDYKTMQTALDTVILGLGIGALIYQEIKSYPLYYTNHQSKIKISNSLSMVINSNKLNVKISH